MGPFSTKLERISENIYIIDQEMVRSYIIVGKNKALCFDFGVADVVFSMYLKEISFLPYIYVLSHADIDHVANIRCADKVYVSEKELGLVKNYDENRLLPAPEGMVFDLGGVSLEVVSTFGHTPGSISLLWRSRKILFSGDTLSYGPIYMFGPARDIARYKRTLYKLSDMEEEGIFTEIYPSHNIFPVKAGIIKELIAIVEGFESGEIKGEDPGIKFAGFENVKLFRFGRCGIYFEVGHEGGCP